MGFPKAGARVSGRRVGCLRFSGCERALGRLSRDAVRSAPWGPQDDPVSDRWHLWKNLCDKALAEVRSHSACWTTANTPRPVGVHEQTTRERWHQLHDLLGKGVGLLECARRLNLSLNTVKRYPRTRDPEALRPVKQLFREVQEQGCTGSFTLLYRSTQGRAEGDRPVTTPRWLARLLLTHPDHLRDKEASLLARPSRNSLPCRGRRLRMSLSGGSRLDAHRIHQGTPSLERRRLILSARGLGPGCGP
ncbi:hypothetical protein ACFT9J_19000 [Streptomyces anthocyanicus]|uniref:hypothetical protein n=1 Tax=Streptomyces anthocyanicus TaxID=68174 RepID=UPI00362F749C